MLLLPEENWSDSDVLADWIELNTIHTGYVTRGAVLNNLKDSRLWEGDADPSDTAQSSHEEASADAWAVLNSRRDSLDSCWPFLLDGSHIERRQKDPTYAALLLMDLGRRYAAGVVRITDSIRSTFEQIVTASLMSLLGGHALRFGAPFPSDWPKGFPDRVSRLAMEFDLTPNPKAIRDLSSPRQKDDALDVVARLRIGDEDPGTLYVLVQCATGENWQGKRGEPSISKWEKYITWHAKTIRAIAIPWAIRPRKNLRRICAHFDDAIVLDRWRIVAGKPNIGLEPSERQRLATWVRTRIRALTEP